MSDNATSYRKPGSIKASSTVSTGRISGSNTRGPEPAPKKTFGCIVCKKYKPLEQFSAKQQALLYKPIPCGSCKVCAGGPTLEMECAMCGKTKALDKFSKSQRRNNNRDNAKCMPCQDQKSRIEPDRTYYEGQDSSDSNEFGDESDDETALENGMNGVRLGSGSSSRPSASASRPSAANSAPPVWVAQPRTGASGSSRTSGKFEHNSYRRTRPGPSSTSRSATSAPLSNAANQSASKGWYKPPKVPDPNALSIVEYGNDEEDDDWNKVPVESSDDDSN